MRVLCENEGERRIWENAYAAAFARNYRFSLEGDGEWHGHSTTEPGQPFEEVLAERSARIADGAIVAFRAVNSRKSPGA